MKGLLNYLETLRIDTSDTVKTIEVSKDVMKVILEVITQRHIEAKNYMSELYVTGIGISQNAILTEAWCLLRFVDGSTQLVNIETGQKLEKVPPF